MDTNELIVRTMNAARKARIQGFEKTADAFDGIVETLLKEAEAEAKYTAGPRANSSADMLHIH